MLDVTVVTANLLTKEFTQNCYESLRRFYPDIPVILVDNGSRDDSTEYIRELGERGEIVAIINDCNLGHGSALHQGTMAARTGYVFALDSDCIIHRGGFLEAMLARFKADDTLFAISNTYVPHSSPAWAMLFDRNKYLDPDIRPFRHHGSPARGTINSANRKGYWSDEYFLLHPDYIEHIQKGTRRLFGGAGDSWHPNDERIRQVREKRAAKNKERLGKLPKEDEKQ